MENNQIDSDGHDDLAVDLKSLVKKGFVMTSTDMNRSDQEALRQRKIQMGRDKWVYRGDKRPDFAVEPGPGQASVWDYPRPPAVVPDNRLVIVRLEEAILAKTKQALKVCETAGPPVFYIPPADINFDLLDKIPQMTSLCEWKGDATYWCVPSDPQTVLGWSYETPFEGFESIKSYLSFYPGRTECTVEGEPVRPQPGHVYGGWILDEIVGPFKGESGTEAW